MPLPNSSSRRNSPHQIIDQTQDGRIENEADVHYDQEDDIDSRRELEVSLSSIDELEDFETFDIDDLIYREYEPVILPDSAHYERFDRLGHHTWKTGRPGHLRSFLQSALCTLQTTLISGSVIGVFLTIVVYLDANLADLCYSYSKSLQTIPEYIQHIRIVSDMVSSVVTQFWHLITLIVVFGCSLIRNSHIISWNILAGLMAGIYKLIYGLFMSRIVFWRSFPSYAIFIFVATFNSFKVSKTLKEAGFMTSPYLVLQLTIQFIIGIPIIFIFTAWINPSYKGMTDIQKVAFASFVPIIIAIPKMILRKSVEYLKKVNHPGTTVYLLMAFYTSTSLLLRTLQVQLYTLQGYIILSIIYGAFSTVERAVLPYVDFLQHRFFKGKRRNLTEFMTPRHNRLMSDLTLTTMITEPSMIIVAGTGMAILQFYYGHSKTGTVYDINALCKVVSIRIVLALLVEIVFNTISLKVESYYFNMPVMKTWKLKKLWFIISLLLNSTIAIMCFSHVIYDAMSTDDFFDGKFVCSSPFQRPIIKGNGTN